MMGIGDWGLGIGPNPQSKKNNKKNEFFIFKKNKNKIKSLIKKKWKTKKF